MSLKARWHALLGAVGESLVCLALAFRSSLRPGIVLRSAGLCLLVFALWSWVFYRYFEPIGTTAGVLSAFVVLGAAVLGLLPGMGGGGSASVTGMPGIGSALAMMFIYGAMLTVAVLVVMYAGLIVATIRLALRWVLLGKVRERVRTRYPALTQGRVEPSGLLANARERLGPWLGMSLGTLLCLMVPLVNGVLLFLLVAYLNVRFLVGPALAGIANGEERMRVVRRQRGAMVVFGVLILLLALVPVLNLLLPALLGAGACHLGCRGLEAERAQRGVAV